MGTVLSINNIDTYYGHSHVLNEVSLQVEERSVVALLGRNGVGKTTTLRSVMGLTPVKNGEINFDGTRIEKKEPFAISRMGMGYVPQGRRLFGSLSVKEHLEVFKRPGADGNMLWTPERALEFFPRLKERYNSLGAELSGGERQMLAIARALVTNPRMVLLDEPTEGLAPLVVREVGELVLKLKEDGATILITEQKIRFALHIADDVYVMSRGKIVYHDSPEDLAQNEEIKRTYLGL